MGRKKTFEEGAVLDVATTLFWQHGFDGTSYQLLERETGLSGRSLINAFGDKEALFAKVLTCYAASVQQDIEQLGSPSVAAILNFFRNIEKSPSHSLRKNGCLLVNTIVGRDHLPESALVAVAKFKSDLLIFFSEALKADNISAEDHKAEFLLSLLWGLSSRVRDQRSVKAVSPTLTVLQEIMTAWQQGAVLSDR
jgi:TetR/AcrR family transcriptional regulator, transcriptional repressor for nem operon